MAQILFLGTLVSVGFYFIRYTLQDQLDKRVSAFSSQFESSLKTAMISMDVGTLRSVGQQAILLPDIIEFNIFLHGKMIVNEKSSKTKSYHIISINKKVSASGQELGAINYSMSLDSLDTHKKNIYITLLMICFFELVFATVLAYLIGKYITNRSNYLISGIEKYASGDSEFKYERKMDDEFGIIAESFNSMTLKLNELRFQNIQSSKMAALGEMAAGVAHEINNPLTIIVGTVATLNQFMPHELKDRELFEKNLERIQLTVRRIVKIISALKTFSRNAESDPFEEVEIKKTIEDSLALCSEKFSENKIELRVKISVESNITILARSAQISQVLINLLSNSLDAVTELKEKWVEIDCYIHKSTLTIKVIDSGNGIKSEFIQRIMEPFFTTKQVGKGTGLGLSISKNIIENHNGNFYYDETSPKTCFIIELPVANIY